MIESSRKTLITIPAGNCLVNSVQPTGQILYAGYEKDMTACLTLANITGKDLDGTLARKFRQGSPERKPQHQFIIPAGRGNIPGHPDKRRITVRRHPRHGLDIRSAFFVTLNGPDDFLAHQFPVAPVSAVCHGCRFIRELRMNSTDSWMAYIAVPFSGFFSLLKKATDPPSASLFICILSPVDMTDRTTTVFQNSTQKRHSPYPASRSGENPRQDHETGRTGHHPGIRSMSLLLQKPVGRQPLSIHFSVCLRVHFRRKKKPETQVSGKMKNT